MKLIVALILITTNIFSSEWIDCRDQPIPEKETCIFYEAKLKQVFIGKAEDFRIFIDFQYNRSAVISLWMPVPDMP